MAARGRQAGGRDAAGTAWGGDLDGLIALARHGAGLVLAPDYCVECRAADTRHKPEPNAGPIETMALVDVLPGWQLLAELDTVQALTLPVPAGSESARALVRFASEALACP